MLRKLLEVIQKNIQKNITAAEMGKNHWKNKYREHRGDNNTRIPRPSKNVYIQFISSGIKEHSPCLFLFTDSKRYIFNCMEGSQRLFTQNRIKIGKLDTFFFTQHQWSHIGGFPGFAMTLRDAKNSANESLNQKNTKKRPAQPGPPKLINVNVYGPEGTKHMLGATHNFMKFERSGMRLETHEFGSSTQGTIYEDFELSVQSIPFYGTVPPVSGSGMSMSQHRLLEPIFPFLTYSPPSLCFAVYLKPLPGKFDVKKAQELGIPPGPLYTKLQMGQDITLEDGRVFKKDDVQDPDIPGTYFLIVDCPSASYIDNLSANNAINKYLCKGDHQATTVIHLGSTEVLSEPKYAQWMEKFQPETKHLFSNSIPYSIPVFRGQYSLQSMLNVVDKDVFPLIEPNVKPLSKPIDNALQIYNLTKVQLRDLGNSAEGLFDHSLCFKGDKIKELQDTASSLLSMSQGNSAENQQPTTSTEFKGETRKRTLTDTNSSMIASKKPLLESNIVKKSYPQVLFLGTGAAIPSKYRNVSATLIFFSETNAVLLDCGEDTYGQLYRHYGDRVGDILKNIKMILISHMHADHHLGLFTLLNQIRKVDGDRSVILAAPYYYRQWFLSYTETCEVLNCQFVSCKTLQSGSWLTKEIFVKAIKVDHPADAHGFLVKDKKHSIVYSGDTKPCQRLIHEGRNCTLLIHEATLEDGMVEDALARKHSTTTQSMEVAQKMNAEYLVMTHFSQRYPQIPKLKNTPVSSRTAIAFDHMELSLDDIPKFQNYIPQIQRLLYIKKKEELEMEELNDTEEEKKNKNANQNQRNKNSNQNQNQKNKNSRNKNKKMEREARYNDSRRNTTHKTPDINNDIVKHNTEDAAKLNTENNGGSKYNSKPNPLTDTKETCKADAAKTVTQSLEAGKLDMNKTDIDINTDTIKTDSKETDQMKCELDVVETDPGKKTDINMNTKDTNKAETDKSDMDHMNNLKKFEKEVVKPENESEQETCIKNESNKDTGINNTGSNENTNDIVNSKSELNNVGVDKVE